MNNYKEKIELEIERCMKQYGLTEDDVRFGNAGQMKGYVMGLKAALEMLNEYLVAKENTEIANRTITTRRSRTSR